MSRSRSTVELSPWDFKNGEEIAFEERDDAEVDDELAEEMLSMRGDFSEKAEVELVNEGDVDWYELIFFDSSISPLPIEVAEEEALAVPTFIPSESDLARQAAGDEEDIKIWSSEKDFREK